MTLVIRAALAIIIGGSVTAASYAVGTPPRPVLGPQSVTVVLDIEHSAFVPSSLRVAEGTTVRFVLANGDPIKHEFITGPDAVHERHRTGAEGEHPPVPGEVSLGPGQRGVTTYTFDEPGTVEFACHLPGHLEYGMRGQIEVVAGISPAPTSEGLALPH